MRSRAGFTMIEMILAMTFVSFLMITIALTTVAMTHTYQRGVTLSHVNSAGRAVMTDMQRTVSQAPIMVDQADVDATSYALCFGNYSYVWNQGGTLASDHPSQVITYSGSAASGQLHGAVRLAKVYDPSKVLCHEPSSWNHIVDSQRATELLPSDSDNGLGYQGIAVQGSMTASQLAHDSTQALYQIAFVLGTNDQSALNRSDHGFATAPNCHFTGQADLSYCAVNRFQFIARAGGGQYDGTN